MQQKSILLAPTGRAAKVFSAYAGHPAFTIHKKIYRQQSFSNEVSNFSVNDNLTTHTLYIVDEASMISNEGLSGAVFGTGRLLDDLIQFVYSGTGCRLVLMGDTAQLYDYVHGLELNNKNFLDDASFSVLLNVSIAEKVQRDAEYEEIYNHFTELYIKEIGRASCRERV